MKFRHKIKILDQTCFACPSQWEGLFDNGDYLYIRYRWGYLTVSRNGKHIFEKSVGGEWDGVLDTTNMLKITGLKFKK